jgi:transposase
VCLETTGLYGDGIASLLHAQVYHVSVVNPARIKAYGDSQLKRNKTDRSDAQLIADFCRTQQPELLTSIPGIGDLTAGRLLAELRDIQAFSSARQVAAFGV